MPKLPGRILNAAVLPMAIALGGLAHAQQAATPPSKPPAVSTAVPQSAAASRAHVVDTKSVATKIRDVCAKHSNLPQCVRP